MTKECLINLTILLLSGIGLVIGLFWIHNYMQVHRCDNPYKQVCVKSHTVIRMMPFVHSNGKTTTTTMRPMPHKICDKYENVLKEGCYDNTDKRAEKN